MSTKRIIAILSILFCGTFLHAATIKDMRYNRMENKVQLVLDVDEAMPFQQFSLANPPRIVLDFNHVKREGRAGIVINEGAVAGVRSGYRNQETLRVVVDLIASAKANIYTLPADAEHNSRIVIDVYDFDTNPALTLTSVDEAMPYVLFAGQSLEDDQSMTQIGTGAIPQTSTNQSITIEREVSSSGQVQRRVEVSSPPISVKRDILVCIDPGHGGKDPGAHNDALGLKEKDLVLAIAKRLQRQLDTMPGYKVFMTRSTDTFIPLRRRTTSCREAKGDLFVSIHADAVESREPSGSSVYILSTHGASSQLAKYLANSENAVDLKWGIDVAKYDDDIQEALLNIQQEATLESSNVLAMRTLSELARIGKIHRSGVERANFVVLRSPEIPSMLVETAFISNVSDAKLLNSQAYQEKLARAIANSIDAYFREYLPQHMLLTQ